MEELPINFRAKRRLGSALREFPPQRWNFFNSPSLPSPRTLSRPRTEDPRSFRRQPGFPGLSGRAETFGTRRMRLQRSHYRKVHLADRLRECNSRFSSARPDHGAPRKLRGKIARFLNSLYELLGNRLRRSLYRLSAKSSTAVQLPPSPPVSAPAR